jgi:very-short-patch-repair endonuclease
VNVYVGPYEVDFLWRHRRLVVETDGYEGHRGRQAFEDDRARDAELRVLGYTVVRFTYRQVTERWGWVEETVRALLAADQHGGGTGEAPARMRTTDAERGIRREAQNQASWS